MAQNEQYWIDRANRRMDGYQISAIKKARIINRSYNQTCSYVQSEIAKILRHIGDEDSLAYEYRMRRLNVLLANTRKMMQELYGITLNDTTDFLRSIIPEAYYHTIFDVAQGAGEQPVFSAVNTRLIDKIVNDQWSGKNYSQRIWWNTSKLSEDVQQLLTTAAMSGESIYKTSRRLSERFGESMNNSVRLIRTETTYACNQAEMASYKSLDIDRYKFVATLDTRTSTICQKLDGKVFETKDAQAGKNLPSMHPNCRSTTIPCFEDGMPELRAARDKDGNRIKVPADMTYPEWYEKYIKPSEGGNGSQKPQKPLDSKPAEINIPAPDNGQPEYTDTPIPKNVHNSSVTDKVTAEKASAVELWETENYKNSTEKGLLILPDGTTKDFGGIEHHVTGKEEDIKLMDGATFTHNHPTDNTFSQNDIVTGLVKGNLKEMRAATSTGDVHILVNNGATEQQRKKFNVDYQQRRMKAANVADAKIRRGEKINKDEYVKSRLETFMSEHAEEYNLSYTKSRIDAEEGIHNIKGKKNKFEPSVNMDCISGSKPITEQLQKELSSEYDKFTETFGKLDNVRVVTAVPYKKDGVWGSYNDNSNELFLFGIGGENGKNVMSKTAKDMYKEGKWSTNSTYHAFRHELGHAWQNKISQSDTLFKQKIEKISQKRDELNAKINLELNEMIEQNLTDDAENAIIKLRKKYLSDYGLDPDNDIDEFISECIAEYSNGSPRETSRTIINILTAKEL